MSSILGAGTVVFLAVGVGLALATMTYVKPGVDLFSWRTLWNPLNVVLFPSLLTSTGQKVRRWSFFAFGVGALLILLNLIVGIAG